LKILALEKEVESATAEHIQPLLCAEAAQVWELCQANVLREIYFRADRPQAVLVLECDNISAAEAALMTLPLVQAGLIEFEIIPLAPYPGFRRLFSERE
jgi:hypothetical protein